MGLHKLCSLLKESSLLHIRVLERLRFREREKADTKGYVDILRPQRKALTVTCLLYQLTYYNKTQVGYIY